MKRKLFLILACLILILALPVSAQADTGPKPSVQIEIKGAEGQTYYGTLLSLNKSTGPASAWDGTPGSARYAPGDEDYEIWEAFQNFDDPDNYYFLQEWKNCSETNALNWTYYPPSPFKILLYFPEDNSFCISPIYEKYAFDSYYTVKLSDFDYGDLRFADATHSITAKKSYNYGWETISLIARVVITILLELGIALLMGFRGKKLFKFLIIVNIITQLILNILLNVVNFNSGPRMFILAYIVMEIIVFLIEGGLYALTFPKILGQKEIRRKAFLYAMVANIASLIIGFIISMLIPGIF